VLLLAEDRARQRQRYHTARGTHLRARPQRTPLKGWRKLLALLITAMPVLCGFGIPFYVFGTYALRRIEQIASPDLVSSFLNSVLTASTTSLLTVMVALLLINAVRLSRSHSIRVAVRLALMGYALPGGIIGLGLLFVLARFDNAVDELL